MVLHIVKDNPFRLDTLQQVKNLAGNADAVLFIQDGVYIVKHDSDKALSDKVPCYVMEDDLAARGLINSSEMFKNINYDEFVALTLNYDKSISW